MRFGPAHETAPKRGVPLLISWGLSGASPHQSKDEDDYEKRSAARTREPSTADRELPTANRQPQTLVHLFPFGVGLALAEEFVVVGDLVHQHPDQADHIWSHCIEPLSGLYEKNRRAQEMTAGDDADPGIHPTYNRV